MSVLPGRLWGDVAARLATHVSAGRLHLLTEDTVRMETVLSLDEAGVPGSRLAAEVRAPELAGGKLDLVVDPPSGLVVEFKYPRDSLTGISPDTMTLGELLRDFLRVAVVPARERWVVQVLNARLVAYLLRLEQRHPLRWPFAVGGTFELHPDVLAGLPQTATRAIGNAALPHSIEATCVAAERVGDELDLFAYWVETPPGVSERTQVVPTHEPSTVSSQTRTGARLEILAAARRVMDRSGADDFTMAEVVADMRSRGSVYADSTIRTMIASHMNADASGPGVDRHADVRRVSRGLYQLLS